MKQIQFWTETEPVVADASPVAAPGEKSLQYATVRMTYVSPQLIEAAIRYRIALGELPTKKTASRSGRRPPVVRMEILDKEVAALRDKVRANMKEQGRVPFILTVDTAGLHPSYYLDLKLPGALALSTIDGAMLVPIAYDRIFDSILHQGHRRSGWVFFPYSSSNGTQLEIDREPSLTLRLDSVEFTPMADEFALGKYDLAWNFNLLPVELPLDAMAQFGLEKENQLSENDVSQLVSAVLSVVAAFQ